MTKEHKQTGKSRKRRMSFKERKEQDLLNALDDVYSAQESDKKQQPANKARIKQTKAKPQGAGKAIVYIDGENVFFQLFEELRKRRLVRNRDDLVKFDLEWLLEQVLGDIKSRKQRYYGTKLKEVGTSEEMRTRTQKMIDHKRRWIGFLTNQNIEFITAGSLRIRNIAERGDDPDLIFEEKGVDVRLAVDMVEDAAVKNIETAIVWSSDADLTSAITAAQNHDVHVIYLVHADKINDQVAGSVDETRTIKPELIVEAFQRAN